jgi:dTDP-4-amino-4,6-dideoxygalactose transaminase
MSIPFVDLKAQYRSIQTEIDAAIEQVISDTAFVGGKYLAEFETAFAAFCTVKHCIGVGNGTDAIHIALRALDVGEGDEVITAANSFVATSEAITMAGARVVFADVDGTAHTIDPESVEAKITPRTRAIIPVHLYGRPVDMDPLLELARAHGLWVIEDAAQAHGATYKGQTAGSMGHVGCFSFYPGKNLGAYGDGGAVVTNNDSLAKRVRMFANHGRIDKYDHEIEGVNSRLDGLQAAILNVKLRHLPDWNRARRGNAALYGRYLSDAGVRTPEDEPEIESVYHLYVVTVDSGRRDDLRTALADRGIASGIHYPIALPNLRAYEYLGHSPEDYPVSTCASGEILSLPMFPELDEEQIAQVADAVKSFTARPHRAGATAAKA